MMLSRQILETGVGYRDTAALVAFCCCRVPSTLVVQKTPETRQTRYSQQCSLLITAKISIELRGFSL